MESPATFGELLRQRAVRLGLVNEQGAADAVRLADYFGARQIKSTPRAVASYFNGERVPRIGKMELILDALDVHAADRLLAYRLAARVEQDPVAHETPSPLDADDSFTVPDFATPVP